MPRKMGLEARKNFRRELIEHLIRESLQKLDVVADSYQLRVMPMDVRHHRFIAMVDLSRKPPVSRIDHKQSLEEIEACLSNTALQRFGLRLDGIYWRVDSPTVPEAESQANGHPGTERGGMQAYGSIRLSTFGGLTENPCQLISEDEKSALLEAISKGCGPNVLHVGDLEYRTDLLPLDDGYPSEARRPPRDKSRGPNRS